MSKKDMEWGKVIGLIVCFGMVIFMMTGCTALTEKAVAAAGGVDAVKLETSGSTSTGTILPNITLGGAVSAVATAPGVEDGKTGAPVFSWSKRNTLFGELFGLDCSTQAMVYIGVPGETASDTKTRIDSIKSIAAAAQNTPKGSAQTEKTDVSDTDAGKTVGEDTNVPAAEQPDGTSSEP